MYNLITTLVVIVGRLFCLIIFHLPISFSANLKTKLKQRLGFNLKKSSTAAPSFKSPIIWVHGASVGEIISAEALIKTIKLIYPHYYFIITSHTLTSQIVIANRFKDFATYQYLPFDCLKLAHKFLLYYKPHLVLWLEQDFLPVFLSQIKKKNIPLYLLNARISDKSFKHWQKFKGLTAKILDNFTKIYPMSLDNEVKFNSLAYFTSKSSVQELPITPKKTRFLGNLKYTNLVNLDISSHFNVEINNLAKYHNLKNYLIDKKVFLALSTHADEEKIITNLHIKLKQDFANLVTIIIPRHVIRTEKLIKELNPLNNSTFIQVYSESFLDYKSEIILIDTTGEVAAFCALASVVFIGKSLSAKYKGGHNLLEPLSLGCCVLFGPNMHNFKDLVKDCLDYNAGFMVQDEIQLHNKIKELFLSPTLLNHCKINSNFAKAKAPIILNKYIEELKCFLN
ncbi:3-deoxy-D-manno-octulosonic acid transferase [Candidatus Hepatincolaceae symbiont of Richtersius coronifer]